MKQKILNFRNVLFFLSIIVMPSLGKAQSINQLENAEKMYNKGNWKEAAAEYEQITQINPSNGTFWYNLGYSYYNLKSYEKSISAYKKCILLGYLKGFAMYNIACCYSLMNKEEEALYWINESMVTKKGVTEKDLLTDTDFDNIKQSSSYKALLPTPNASLNRIEKWIADIERLDHKMRSNHINMFHSISEKKWNAELNQIKTSLPLKDDIHIITDLMKLIASIGDGHTSLYPVFQGKHQFHILPIVPYNFSDGNYIISTESKYANLLGAKIISINDFNIDSVKKKVSKLLPQDNGNNALSSMFSTTYLAIPEILYGLDIVSDINNIKITLLRDGKIEHVTFKSTYSLLYGNDLYSYLRPGPNEQLKNILDNKSLPLYLKNITKAFWFEYNKNTNILYCQINKVAVENGISPGNFAKEITKNIDKQKNVKALVIDLRFNSGGNGALNQEFINEIVACQKINKYGKLYCVIGPHTFSAAMNLAASLEKNTNVIFVGTPTGSSPNHYGDDNPIILPNQELIVSVANAYWQSKYSYDNRKWIAPHALIHSTFTDYMSLKDPVWDFLEMNIK